MNEVLPNELIIKILCELSLHDVINMHQCNKFWHDFLNIEEIVWLQSVSSTKTLVNKDYILKCKSIIFTLSSDFKNQQPQIYIIKGIINKIINYYFPFKKDLNAIKFWNTYFFESTLESIDWDLFAECFFDYMKKPDVFPTLDILKSKSNDYDEIVTHCKLNDDEVTINYIDDYNCLKYMLCRDNTNTVTIESFSNFVKWFGPFEGSYQGKNNIMIRMRKVLKNISFSGFRDSNKTCADLKQYQDGTFSIRFSETKPGTYVLMRKNKGQVYQTRIDWIYDRGFYFEFCTPDGKSKNEIYSRILSRFLKKIKKMTNLQYVMGSVNLKYLFI